MIHRARRTFALAFVGALALTAFVSTGSAATVHPDPWLCHGVPPAVDVYSHAPKVDVYRHTARART